MRELSDLIDAAPAARAAELKAKFEQTKSGVHRVLRNQATVGIVEFDLDLMDLVNDSMSVAEFRPMVTDYLRELGLNVAGRRVRIPRYLFTDEEDIANQASVGESMVSISGDIELRKYKREEGSGRLQTVCSRTGEKVGGNVCQTRCKAFISISRPDQVVKCRREVS